MPFDIESARASRKSDAEIANYLATKLNFDADAARKAGKTDSQIAEYLAKNERPQTSTGSSISEDATRVNQLKESMGPIRLGATQGSAINNAMPFGQKIATAASNIPSNAWQIAKDTGNFFANTKPQDVLATIAKTGLGGLATALPKGMQTDASRKLEESFSPIKESVQGFIKHPVDTMAKRIIEKPVSYALDVAGLMSMANIGKALPPSSEISSVVKNGIDKGIRPTVSGKGTMPKVKAYYQKAEDAVTSIIGNKKNLTLTTPEGEVVSGLPKSLHQFGEAIDQTKKSIFKQYDDMSKAAGGSGAMVDTGPIVTELNNVAANRVTSSLHPEIAELAKKQADRFTKLGALTAEEAQAEIANINSKLQVLNNRTVSLSDIEPLKIDALIQNNLRKGLDDAITNAVGPGYQALKSKYGSLKALEKEVNSRAIVDARKNTKGLIDMSDIYSATQLAGSIVGGGPIGVAKAGVAEAIKHWWKYKNNPNIHIENMFKKTEKLLSNQTTGNVLTPLSTLKNAGYLAAQSGRIGSGLSDKEQENFLGKSLQSR